MFSDAVENRSFVIWYLKIHTNQWAVAKMSKSRWRAPSSDRNSPMSVSACSRGSISSHSSPYQKMTPSPPNNHSLEPHSSSPSSSPTSSTISSSLCRTTRPSYNPIGHNSTATSTNCPNLPMPLWTAATPIKQHSTTICLLTPGHHSTRRSEWKPIRLSNGLMSPMIKSPAKVLDSIRYLGWVTPPKSFIMF